MGIVIKGLFDFDLLKTVAVSVGLVVIIRKIICSKVEKTHRTVNMNVDRNEVRHVKEQCKLFARHFPDYLQATLKLYCKKVEDKVQRIDDDANASAMVQTAFNMDTILTKLAPAIIRAAMLLFNINREKTLVREIVPLVIEAKIDDAGVRRTLAVACCEIFKSYEFIFKNIQAKGDLCAMQILAEECAVAVINHLVLATPGVRELTVDVILEAIQKLDCQKSKNIFIRGLEKMWSDIATAASQNGKNLSILGGKELNSTKVLANVGLMSEDKIFFSKKVGKSSTEKYFYRRFFPFEKFDPALHQEEPNQFGKMIKLDAILTDQNKQAMVEELLGVLPKTNNDVVADVATKVATQIKEFSEVVGNHNIRVGGNRIRGWNTNVEQRGRESALLDVVNNEIDTWTLNAKQGGS